MLSMRMCVADFDWIPWRTLDGQSTARCEIHLKSYDAADYVISDVEIVVYVPIEKIATFKEELFKNRYNKELTITDGEIRGNDHPC